MIGAAAILGAGITGFYMTRMVAMTFFGKARWEDDVHPHESPAVMTIPLVILAIGSTFLGMALLFWGNIETWLEPVVGFASGPTPLSSITLMAITLVVVLIGAFIGWRQYGATPVPIEAPRGNWLTRAARRDLYGDDFNEVVVVRPSFALARWLTWFDSSWIDGVVGWVAAFVGGVSGRLRRTQSGFARSYALSMLGGAVLIVAALVLVRLS